MNITTRIIKKATRIAVAVAVSAALALAPVAPAIAAVNWPAPAAKISFTFDDGNQSVYTQARTVLNKYGIKGTSYVTTGCVGMTTIPNTCRAGTGSPYMTWAQIKQLYSEGWDISSHSVTHPYLATSDASDGQPNVLTPAQVENELKNSKAAFTAQGIDARGFASPYGDYNNAVLAAIARHYESQRGFQDIDNNVWSYNDYIINDMPVQAGVTVAQVKARIDAAIANKHWLVLTFHDIKTTASTNPDDYEYRTADLDQIAAYVKTKVTASQIKSVTMRDGIVKSDTNLLSNGGFVNGFNTWSTNAPANIKADNANNGSYPNPANAVSITSGATNQSLYSQQMLVDSAQTYMVKSFMNLKAITAGELGWYVDEYDAAGNWISGKWMAARYRAAVQNVNFTYTPSSSAVKKASLQIYTTANSGIQAYMDNFQFFSLSGTTTPPPTTTNLLPGGTFTGGMQTGWSTNSAAAFAPQNNALKLTAQSAATHLFAPQVSVTNSASYTVKATLNVQSRTKGEVAFYIDEYNAAGIWISGQYIYAKNNTGSENVSFGYIPSSNAVTKARLQTILAGGSGISGILDEVQFLAPANQTPAPEPTNLVANGTFDAGLSQGWTTNSATTITANAQNNGSPSNPVNSIKLTSATAERHLFGPQVAVSAAKTYSIASWLNVTARTTGEIGYYIDEYDAAGNWISGQYKAGVAALGSGDRAFTYTPSSASVTKASLQIIVAGNSGITAYADHVRWYQN